MILFQFLFFLFCLSQFINTKICYNSMYYCPEGTTCCKGLEGYRCCNGLYGNCCSDGVNTCPFNTICNIKQNNCYYKNMPFVSIEPEFKYDKHLSCEPAKLNFITPTITNYLNCLTKAKETYPIVSTEISNIITSVKSGNYIKCFFQMKDLHRVGLELYTTIRNCFN